MIIQLQFSEIMYTNYLVRISTTKRVLTGLSTKIKIKKITERIKNISELKKQILINRSFKEVLHVQKSLNLRIYFGN
jgi:hypothetical protein